MSASGAVERMHFQTSVAEQGTEVIRSLYADHTPSFSGNGRRYSLELSSATVQTALGALSVDRLHNSMRLLAPVEPASALIMVVVTSGYGSYRQGREQTGPTFVAPHWAPFVCEWDDVSCTLGVLDLDGARRVAAELSGLEPGAVEFTAMRPVSEDAARYLASTMRHIEHDLLGNDEAMAGPLVRGEAFRQLATAAALTFPNTALEHLTDPSRPGPGRVEPATVRRAIDYIDAHAHEDITIGQIAAAARIDTRGLHAAFQTHRRQTPLAYLRRVRLERAHRDLQAADPTRGDTVAAIAARWGFAHPGRFAVQYARLYGCSPAQTLHG